MVYELYPVLYAICIRSAATLYDMNQNNDELTKKMRVQRYHCTLHSHNSSLHRHRLNCLIHITHKHK